MQPKKAGSSASVPSSDTDIRLDQDRDQAQGHHEGAPAAADGSRGSSGPAADVGGVDVDGAAADQGGAGAGPSGMARLDSAAALDGVVSNGLPTVSSVN